MLRSLLSQWRIACLAVLVAGAIYAAGPEGGRMPVDSAYFEGNPVPFTVADPAHTRGQLRVGPWLLGMRLADTKPRDRRRNLYLVFPGTQHRSAHSPEFDHNCVLSDLPSSDEAVEWDVYWAVVLDPTLHDDFRSEQELLLAAQSGFFPPDLLDFDDLPADGFLRTQLKIRSLAEVARFRHKDGTLPRLLIVPSGFAIRASTQPRSEHQN